jgi:hypothetical protein
MWWGRNVDLPGVVGEGRVKEGGKGSFIFQGKRGKGKKAKVCLSPFPFFQIYKLLWLSPSS